jgi:hypothetical protein
MIGKVLIAVFGVFLLVGVFSTPIIDGVHDWRTMDIVETVAVGAGATTENKTLGYDLFQASITEVGAVTSTAGTDVPNVVSYTEATNILVINGLDATTTRTLTIPYDAETDDTVMRILGPFLVFLIMGGCLGALLWAMLGNKRG